MRSLPAGGAVGCVLQVTCPLWLLNRESFGQSWSLEEWDWDCGFESALCMSFCAPTCEDQEMLTMDC